MAGHRPRVGLACSDDVRKRFVAPEGLARLEEFADFTWEEFTEPSSWDEPPPQREAVETRLAGFASGLDVLLVCHGAPRVTAAVLDAAPSVVLVGELEGDRFARRIDVDAARERGVRAVDTTHASSYPVAEWALGLMLVGLRNAGALFRRLTAGEVVFADPAERTSDPSFARGSLTGKTVGLLGCGYIGRRLLDLLAPFDVDVYVHDPYVPRELADIYDITLTTLDHVLALPDIVVCLVPLTPATRGMLGRRELDLIRDEAVFVNVSRGAVVDSDALVSRLRGRGLVACLDVFDPEPIPADAPIRDLPNVFCTPHIAGVTAGQGAVGFSLMTDEIARFHAGHETRHDLCPRVLANRAGVAADAAGATREWP